MALPSAVARHLDAKFSELIDSVTLLAPGEAVTIIKTLESPLRESCSRCVSFEFR